MLMEEFSLCHLFLLGTHYCTQSDDLNHFIVFAYRWEEWKEQYMAMFCNFFLVPVGYSGYQDYYPYGRPGYPEEAPMNYNAYTAGLSEEEQLERALRASLWDRGRNSAPFTSKAYLTW